MLGKQRERAIWPSLFTSTHHDIQRRGLIASDGWLGIYPPDAPLCLLSLPISVLPAEKSRPSESLLLSSWVLPYLLLSELSYRLASASPRSIKRLYKPLYIRVFSLSRTTTVVLLFGRPLFHVKSEGFIPVGCLPA